MTMMDVFNFRLKYKWKYAWRDNGYDAWHGTKWILIAYLIVDKLDYSIPVTYTDAGLMLMWLILIVVGLHHIILHKLF